MNKRKLSIRAHRKTNLAIPATECESIHNGGFSYVAMSKLVFSKLPFILIFITGCIFMTSGLYGQDTSDKEVLSGERLQEILEDVRSWTAETIEFLRNAKDLSTQEIVVQANSIRVKFDPLMVLMATTDPEDEYKQAAVMLLMGAKGVELALWHYIYAVLGNSQSVKDHGDVLLGAAVSQLNDAKTLFSQQPEQQSE